MPARLPVREEPAAEALVDALRTLRADDNAPVYVQIELARTP